MTHLEPVTLHGHAEVPRDRIASDDGEGMSQWIASPDRAGRQCHGDDSDSESGGAHHRASC